MAVWQAHREGLANFSMLASHVLEHLANPLGALAEWRRVVGAGGHILLIVPQREGTFDHRRPVTKLEHLRADARELTGEDDLTHLPEILRWLQYS